MKKASEHASIVDIGFYPGALKWLVLDKPLQQYLEKLKFTGDLIISMRTLRIVFLQFLGFPKLPMEYFP